MMITRRQAAHRRRSAPTPKWMALLWFIGLFIAVIGFLIGIGHVIYVLIP